jgi:hypothetical protein
LTDDTFVVLSSKGWKRNVEQRKEGDKGTKGTKKRKEWVKI